MKYYHITSPKRLESILAEGLQPRFGARTRRLANANGIPDEDRYLSIHVCGDLPTVDHMTKLSLWRSHPEFIDGQVVLEVETDEVGKIDTMVPNRQAFVLRKPIPRERIRVLKIVDNKPSIVQNILQRRRNFWNFTWLFDKENF